MATKKHRIKGRVIDRTSRRGIPKLRVEAWDNELILDERVGSEVTNKRGVFKMDFSASHLRKLFHDRKPNLYFKIYRNNKEIHSTQDELIWNYDSGAKELIIALEMPSKQEYLISGYVRTSDNIPVPGVVVEAFDKKVGKKPTSLGKEKTNDVGYYHIDYTKKAATILKNETANLFVQVYDKKMALIGTSSSILDAANEVTLDVSIDSRTYKGLSEFLRSHERLRPLVESVDPHSVSDRDIDVLSRRSGLTKPQVFAYIDALRLAHDIQLGPDVAYALISGGFRPRKSALLSWDHNSTARVLQWAVSKNVVPAETEAHANEVVEHLKALSVEMGLAPAAADEPPSLGQILEAGGIAKQVRRQVVSRHVERPAESLEDLSTRLGEDPELKKSGVVESIQRALKFWQLSSNHLPMVRAFQGLLEVGEIDRASDLAKLDEARLQNLILHGLDGDPMPTPPSIPGDTPEEKSRNYADTIMLAVAKAYPTPAFARELARLRLPGQDDVIDFLEGNPIFDIRSTNVDSFLEQETTNLSGLRNSNVPRNEVKENLAKELKSWQRIYVMSPLALRHKVMAALKSDGLDSALKIRRLGRGGLVRKLASANIPEEMIQQIYRRASRLSGMAANLLLQARNEIGRAQPYVLNKPASPPRNLGAAASTTASALAANLQALFGTIDFCECEHCRSVYGPTAYFVDLLEWLRSKGDYGPYWILSRDWRRGDLIKIELTCKNTNTVLPQIDLVNEILENAVAKSFAGLPSPVVGQTSGTEEELVANPEHFNEDAYAKLTIQRRPWSLPFDFWLEQARLYLGHLKVRLYEIIEAINSYAWGFLAPGMGTYSEHLTREVLGFTTVGYREAIHAVRPGWDPWVWFGLAETNNHVPNPDDPNVEDVVGFMDAARRVPIFMDKTGLWGPTGANDEQTSFNLLMELLDTNFVQQRRLDSTHRIRVEFDPDHPCDLNRATIPRLEESSLEVIARFERLRRQLGWTMHELDLAITTFVPNDLDADFLETLSQVKRLHDELRVPIVELLSWWGDIDTRRAKPRRDPEYRSLYEQVFRDKSVYEEIFNPPDPTSPSDDPFLTNDIGTELMIPFDPTNPNADLRISAHASRIAATLSIEQGDLFLLLDQDDTADPPKQVHDQMNLANLSALYRIVSLCNTLRLEIREFLSLGEMTGVDPFDPSSPAATSEFVKIVREIRLSEYTISDLDYLLRHESRADSPYRAWTERSRLLVKDIRESLQRIKEERIPVPDPTGDLMKQRLSLLFEPEVVKTAFEIISGGSSEPDQAKKDFIDTYLALFVSNSQALNNLKDELVDNRPNESLVYFTELVSAPLLEHLRESTSAMLITRKIAEALGLGTEAATKLISNVIVSKYDLPNPRPSASVLRDFLDLARNGLTEKTVAAGLELRGYIQPEYSETYRLKLHQTAGVLKLWIDGDLVLDGTTAGNSATLESEVEFEAGRIYEIWIELNTTGAPLIPHLAWSSNSIPEEPVPVSRYLSEGVVRIAVNALHLLQKVAILIDRWKLNPREISHLAKHGTDFDGFNWNDLPLEQSTYDAVRFRRWRRLNSLFSFRDSFSEGPSSLVDVLEAAYMTAGHAVERLAEFTGWKVDDVHHLATQLRFVNIHFKDEKPLHSLKRFFDLQKRIGVSIETLLRWGKPHIAWSVNRVAQPDIFAEKKRVAEECKEAVRAKYSQKEWLEKAKLLRDVLRERQRNALVAFFSNRAETPADLSAKFLIDVEMTACRMTTRIKQAISSVQLYVQRSLMSYETNYWIDEDTTREWKWMKNYRVWEANRKVFLYPENWIEPELRDDKTPLFETLEADLLQDEVTEDSAEAVLNDFVDRLYELQRLEIAGLYIQWPSDALNPPEGPLILHVFGRTRGLPHTYYYRSGWYDRTTLEHGGWTPWEKVDLDIDGDHITPVVYKDQLYLFWPIFLEKSKDAYGSSGSDYDPRHLEIKLAWSRYQNGRWLPKKLSDSNLVSRDYWEPGKRPPKLGGGLWDDPLTLDKSYYRLSAGVIPYLTADKTDYKFVLAINAHLVWKSIKMSSTGGNFLIPPDWDWPTWWYYAWYEVGKFEVHDCNDAFLPTQLYGYSTPVPIPTYTRPEAMMFSFDREAGAHPNNLWDTNFELLARTPETFSLLYAHQYEWRFDRPVPFFYQDLERTFLLAPQQTETWSRYHFDTFYHPHVCDFKRRLREGGPDVLLQLETQQPLNTDYFDLEYEPSTFVTSPYPSATVDFDVGEPYASYNWELFFHLPFLVATRLSQNQQFEEAQRWFHFIFNPMKVSSDPKPQRYWNVLPLFEKGQPRSIVELMELLADPSIPDPDGIRAKMVNQVREWEQNPFQPHRIARMRVGAYQRSIVMKYLDNLIAWGDQLFGRFSMESLSEATQIYTLAAHILGRRPEELPPRGDASIALTYEEVLNAGGFDEFSNTLVDWESLLVPTFTAVDPDFPWVTTFDSSELLYPYADDDAPPPLPSLYFCIPENDKLLEYWDIVEDRLFKIRHCRDIEGLERQPPLWEPPIDPALLVRAAAAGIDIGSALNDLSAPLPHYRFVQVFQKAVDLCADVRGLAAALLTALEKRDAEALSLLRAGHEKQILKAVRRVREDQIREATATISSLQKSLAMAKRRHAFYSSRQYMNSKEKLQIKKLEAAHQLQAIGQGMSLIASIVRLIPEFHATMIPAVQFGGANLGDAFQTYAQVMNILAAVESHKATMAQFQGGYDRRRDDWDLQSDLAGNEIGQAEKQVVAAEIRRAIAESELKSHEKQIENAEEYETFLQEKFTNAELYRWMVSEIASTYFQSYQLAYDMAKRAQKALQFELGMTDATFVSFGYWDSLKKGLLAGEKLHHDLKRMDVAYLEQNKREYEITKSISFAAVDPVALLRLKAIGECEVNISEELLDFDYPGDYMRRIKSVSLSIPSVTGPYTNVNCKLTLLANWIRHDSSSDQSYAPNPNLSGDARFKTGLVGAQSMVTSSGNADSGLFEVSLADPRYLPFEGAGVISLWHLDLSKDDNWFDFHTIADVILTIRYTAREGGDHLEEKARTHLRNQLSSTGLFKVFSARHDFPDAWHRFLAPSANPSQMLELDLSRDRFPMLFGQPEIKIKTMTLLLWPAEGVAYYDYHDDSTSAQMMFRMTRDGAAFGTDRYFSMQGSAVDPLPSAIIIQNGSESLGGGKWSLEVDRSTLSAMRPKNDAWVVEEDVGGTSEFWLDRHVIADIWVVVDYTLS